jgi:hypothetical protein
MIRRLERHAPRLNRTPLEFPMRLPSMFCSFARLLPLTVLALMASGSDLSAAPQEDEAQESAYPELTLTESRTWLDELSTWQQELLQPEGSAIDKRVRGVYPIGDGYVFGYVGLGRRANTMQGLSGPSYQTSEVWAPKGHWGELSIDVLEDKDRVALPIQRVWRTRGVNTAITEDASDAEGTLSLYTLNFAKAPDRAIYRWVELRNRGEKPRKLSLLVSWEKGSSDGQKLVASYAAKGFSAELVSLRPATAAGSTLRIELGELSPGAVATVPLILRCKAEGQAYAGALDEASVLSALDGCQRNWKEKLRGTSTFASDRKDISDLIEDWKILMLVQRSEPSGAVSPMVSYRGTWVRDNVGPLLAFLRYGLHDEARQMLEYVHDATVVGGVLRNHFELDLDVSGADEKRKQLDWSKVRIPGTELPGWIILQHAWYFRATWDISLIQKHWPLLEACMKAFRPDIQRTLPTHGDETYLHGAFFSIFPARAASPSYLPADMPGRRARSFDSSMLYLMSIDAMSELVEELDKVAQGEAAQNREWSSEKKAPWEKRKIETLIELEKAFWLPEEQRFAPFLSPITGAPHRAPFAAVNLKQQWIGYTYAIGEKNRQNAENSIKALWKKGTRVGMTPTIGHFTGAVPGYLLYTLADLNDKRRNDALDELVRLAGPAGEWAELYDPEGRPIGAYSEEWPNRLRPWESGINIDAILFALNGARYVTVPGWSKKDQRYEFRIPNGARWVSMKAMQHDGHQYNVYLDEVFDRDKDIDPSGKPVRKMRFRVHYDRVNFSLMQTDKVDMAVDVGGSLYVRYPSPKEPTNETCAWPEEQHEHFVGRDGVGTFVPKAPSPVGSGNMLFLTAGLTPAPENAAVVDIGMPMSPEGLAALFMSGDQPRYGRIVFDVGARRATRRTFKTGNFWNHPSLLGAQKSYRAAGGKILRPRFITRFQYYGPEPVRGRDDLDEPEDIEKLENFRGGEFAWQQHVNSGEYFDLAALTASRKPELAGKSYVYWISSVVVSDAARDAILRVGSDDGIRVLVNGKEVLSRKVHRVAAVDQDEVLIRLEKGENKLLFKVLNEDGGCGLYARITGTDGLPIEGLRYR